MAEKPRNLLDSFAIMALAKREPGFEKVKASLQQARKTSQPALINEMNIGEVYYSLIRDWSLEQADRFLSSFLLLPVERVHNSYEDILEAARIKARFRLSFADAFAVATALRTKAVILTGDREFEAVAGLVRIEWL
jgi:predicted nucleic acid-binding protein